MLIAAFSDVHGNLHALDAVLGDIAQRGADRVVCLGDLVGYGAFPDEVIARVRAEGIATLAGNYDDGVGFDREDCGCAYRTAQERALGDASLRWTKAAVSDEHKAWLGSLPREIRMDVAGKRLLCVHGSPRRINEYLFEDRPQASLERIVAAAEADVMLAGHTHLAYHKTVGGAHLINVGSAGKPKDGDPRAGYALVEVGEAVSATFPRVAYEVEAAARAIEAAEGLPDEFARALRTAR